mmetsp:Transcript_61031/g.125862  ORF Transcript_61031/g.125862 Transcript_61031/m.125862 type:complete len:200 (+) Transcript_61031:310-909(+)
MLSMQISHDRRQCSKEQLLFISVRGESPELLSQTHVGQGNRLQISPREADVLEGQHGRHGVKGGLDRRLAVAPAHRADVVTQDVPQYSFWASLVCVSQKARALPDNGSCFRSDAQFPRGPQEVAHPVTEPPHGVLDVHSGGWDVHDAREPVFHPTLDRDQDPVDHRDGREYNWFASANLVKVGSGTTTQLSSTPPCCRL